MTLVITGASGGIGGRVARLLADRDDLRLVVRDASRAPDIPGADVAVAEYGDPDSMNTAFEGASTVFLVSAGEARDRVQLHYNAVDAAARAGMQRIVYVSFAGASADATFTFARDHFHTEQRIRASGVRHTFLRDSMYADYIPEFGASGEIRGPAGEGRVSWVTRDDIARAAAAVLSEDDGSHDGKTYEMTGPEALTMAETVAILSEVAGREVRYVEETLEEARESRRPTGAPDWEIEGWVTSYYAIAVGDIETVSDDIERLTGRAPESVREWLERNPESLRAFGG